MPAQKRRQSTVPQKEQALRKAVLKGDQDEIVTLIGNGADPNFISKTVPGQKALKQYHSAIDLAVTKSKKPVESLQAIVDACKKHKIKMNLQPTDPLILDDETQLKTSVLQKACLSISQPKKLCDIIKILAKVAECDFNYASTRQMNALAYLLHLEAAITDPREPLKLLLRQGCDPFLRVKFEGSESESDYGGDERLKFNYASYQNEPAKFHRSIAYAYPECQNTWPDLPKWCKKEKMKEDINNECHQERKRRSEKKIEQAKKLQQEVQLEYTYFPIYQDANAPKRKDKKKIEADLHCQIYFLSVAPENTEKSMKQKFKLNDQKYNLKSRKDRNESDKELKTYDPDCQCCQARKLADESNNAEIKTPVQKRRKPKTPKKKNMVAVVEDTAECNGCGAKSTLKRPLMACSQCKKVKYCGRECQRDDWAEHRKICRKQNTTPSKDSNSKNSLETLLVDSGKTDQESSETRVDKPVLKERHKNGQNGRKTPRKRINQLNLNAVDSASEEPVESEPVVESTTTVVAQSTDDWQQKEVIRPSSTPVKKSVHVAPIPPDKIPIPKVAQNESSKNLTVSILISSEEENGFVPFNKPLKRRSGSYQESSPKRQKKENISFDNVLRERLQMDPDFASGLECTDKLDMLAIEDNKAQDQLKADNNFFEKLIRSIREV